MSSDPPPTSPPTDPSPTPGTGPTTTTPPRDGSGFHRSADEFFDRIRGLGVTRPSDGRWGTGVAAGLARRWDIDVVLVRGVFVALALMGGVGVAAYGLAWLLLPQTDGRIHLQAALRGHVTAGLIGAVLLTLSAISGGGPGPWHNGYWFGRGFPGGLVLSVLIIGGIWWYARHEGEKHSPMRDGENPLPPAPTTSGSPAPGSTSSTTPGSTTPGSTTPGSTTPGSTTPGSTTPGSATSSPGEPVHGQPVYGQPVYGQPVYGQPVYGEPVYGTPPAAASTWQYVPPAPAEYREAARQHVSRRALAAPSRPLVRATLGVALLTAAIVFVLGNANDWSASVPLVAAAAALAVIAAGVLVSGFLGRRSAGLAALGLLLAVGTLLGSAADHAGVQSGQHLTAVGERTWRPTTIGAAEKQFNLGVGSATLDLTDPGILTGPGSEVVDVRVRMGVGDFTIVVPDEVASRVDVRLTAGEIVRPDNSRVEVKPNDDNHRQTITAGPATAPRLVLDVQQGVGQLRITPQSRLNQVTPTPSATPTPATTN